MANMLNKDPFTYAKDRRDFVEDLKSFHASRGTPFDQLPKLEGTEVDLYRLYRRVVDFGGWRKANQSMLWDDIVEEFNIPPACTNGAQALKFVYIRYLNAYEKVKLWGVSPDEEGGDAPEGHSRKRVFLPLELIPQSYNYSQHIVTDAEREAHKLSTDLVQPRDYEKLEMALRSGLPNEVDFALNICVLKSAQHGKEAPLSLKLPGNSCHLVALLLANVGIFEEGPSSMESVMVYNWNNGESKRDYRQFWLDIVKNEQLRETLKINNAACRTGEQVGEEVLHLGRELGMKDLEGQRVTQLAVLVRNLSFEEVNQQLLASNQLVFRFLMLCVHGTYSNLRQLALETLGNLASQMVLQSLETQLMMNLILKSLQDDDKFVILRALEMLSKLCQQEKNEGAVRGSVDAGTCERLVQLLMVRDVQLVVHTLETLYQLTSIGETTSTMIAAVRTAVDILVNMITLDVKSLGLEALRGMRLVECLPQDGVVDAGRTSSTQQPSTYFIEAVHSDLAPEAPAEPVEKPLPVNKIPTEVEKTAANWLSSTYELKADSSVPEAELYAEYQQMAKKFNMTRFLSLPDLLTTVKWTLPQVCVSEVDRGGGGKEGVVQGLCKRPQAKPFAILTGSANPCAEPSPSAATAMSVVQTCRPLPPVVPKPQPPSGQTAAASSASVGCQVASLAAAPPSSLSSGQGAGKAHGVQTSKMVSVSSQQALKAKLLNHQLLSLSLASTLSSSSSSSIQQAGAVNSSKTPNGKQQQTNHRKIMPSTTSPWTATHPSSSTSTSTSSPVVPASSSLTSNICASSSSSSSSSSSAAAAAGGSLSTWITIPCSGQPFQSKNHHQHKSESASGKTVSRGEQTAESSMVKTLLAQKVCQQNGGGGHQGTSSGIVPITAAAAGVVGGGVVNNPASFLCVSPMPGQSHHPTQQQQQQQQQQFRLKQLAVQAPSPAVQFYLQSQQQSVSAGVGVRPSLTTPQTVLGQNPLQTVHMQQAGSVPIQHAASLQQQLAHSQLQQTLQRQAAAAVQQGASQQVMTAAALQQKAVVAVQQSASQQAAMTALQQQQQTVVVQSLSQTPPPQQQQQQQQVTAQSHTTHTLQQQQQQTTLSAPGGQQRSWQQQQHQPQAAGQQPAQVLQPQSQSSILKHLMGTQGLAQMSSLYHMAQGHPAMQQATVAQSAPGAVTPQSHPATVVAPANFSQVSGKTVLSSSSSQQQSGMVQVNPGGQNMALLPPQQADGSQAGGPLVLSSQPSSVVGGGAMPIRVQQGQQQQQVLQVQPHVHQQVIQMNGQHYIVRQHVLQQQPRQPSQLPQQQQQQQIQIQCRVPGQQLQQQQPQQQQQQQQQTLQLPGGQIVLRGSQPVQVAPQQQQQVMVQQQGGQPAQLLLQGQTILQTPSSPSVQGQGQAVRIQGQPMVIQLPIQYGWPAGAGGTPAKVVSVCGTNVNSSASPLLATTTPAVAAVGQAGSAPQGGGGMAYRAIVPRPTPSTTPSLSIQCGGLQQSTISSPSVPLPAGQQAHATLESGGVRQDSAGTCANGARWFQQQQQQQQVVSVKTGGHGAGGGVNIPSACRTSAAQVSVPSTVSVTWSLPSSSSSSVPLFSSQQQQQHVSTAVQSSSSSASLKSGHSSPHIAARYNGHVNNGARLHKELTTMCNGVDEDNNSAENNKVNGVSGGSPRSSDEGEVPPSPLMSLRVKKEMTNGYLERCVPYQVDSATGCSKEWLQNLRQQTVQINLAFSQDQEQYDDDDADPDPMEVDNWPQPGGSKAGGGGGGQNGVDANHKVGAWQRNGLVVAHAHARAKDVVSASLFCRGGTLTKQSSMDEVSLDSTDSGLTFGTRNGGGRGGGGGGEFGNRLLISPDGSYDGDRSCDSRASSVTDFSQGESQGFRPIVPTLCSTATSPTPPTPSSFSANAQGNGTKRKAAPSSKKASGKNKKQKSGSSGSVGVGGGGGGGCVGGERKAVVAQAPSRTQSVGTTLVMEYMCEWAGCCRRFNSAGQVFVHVTKSHVSDLPELICRWEGCQPLRRKRWSLVTHVQDHHCTEAGQRAACQRRFLQAHKAVLPPTGPTQAMAYPEDAAQQAILRFQRQAPFVEFTTVEKEDPLTKHIRLTSALTLRNIARYSALGRRLIRRREEELSCAALSVSESSNALAGCLWELISGGM